MEKRVKHDIIVVKDIKELYNAQKSNTDQLNKNVLFHYRTLSYLGIKVKLLRKVLSIILFLSENDIKKFICPKIK